MTYRQAVRPESRMKGVTHGSMSSVQLCRHFPHAALATARCEAGKEAQDGNAANAFCRARRRSEGRTRVNSPETRREVVRPPFVDTAELGKCEMG